MEKGQAVAAHPEEHRVRSFLQVLMSPTVDRAIAVVAIIPMVLSGYYRYKHFGLNLPVLYYLVATFVLVLTMVFRRPPKRVTSNPWFWLLAFVNTYFPQAIVPFLDRGRLLVSPLLSNVLALAALLFTLWARLSLGRNIGFVPAQCEIVTAGAYRYVRHLHRTDIELSGGCDAYLQSTQCRAVGNRRFLDDRQKLRGGEFPPCRPAIRRIHDERTRTLDSLPHLKQEQSAPFASLRPLYQVR
jgi:hypothetical protein